MNLATLRTRSTHHATATPHRSHVTSRTPVQPSVRVSCYTKMPRSDPLKIGRKLNIYEHLTTIRNNSVLESLSPSKTKT